MPQLPILSGRQVIKILSRIGYVVIWQKGSHIRLDCPHRKRITIPNYRSIDRGLLLKIIRNVEITAEEFLKLL